MPVAVHIPIRIRVSSQAVEGCTCSMEEALSSAVSRALVKSGREVLAPRTGYAGIRMMAPEFEWRGDAAGLVAPVHRRKVEEKVRAALAAEIRHVGLLRWGQKNAEGLAPLAGPVRALFDEKQGSDVWGFYSLASYQKGGKRKAVKMKPAPVAQTGETLVDVWDPKPWNWYTKVTRENFLNLFNATFEQWSIARGRTPFEGIIWRTSDGDTPLQMSIGNYKTGEAFGVNVEHFIRYEWKPVPGSKTAEYAFVAVRFLPDPQPNCHAEWKTAEQVRESIQEHSKKQVASMAKPAMFSDQDWEKKKPQVLEAQIKARTKFIGSTTQFLAVVIGNNTLYVNAPGGGTFPGQATLACMTERQVVQLSPEGEGAGGAGADAGTGGGKGAGAGAGAAGQIQPHWGDSALHYPGIYDPNGRSPQRCKEGYRGEPSLDQLPPATAEKLRRLIAEIAYLLEMEPCEYAGSFCLAAAEEVGFKALTVSRYSVLPGHSGMVELAPNQHTAINVVDFLPDVSPGILFLRMIASAVPRISKLADLVGLTYRAPGVAERLASRSEQAPIDWLLHFGGEVYERLRLGVVRHFVATTQVLFMQYLAMSLENIYERLKDENFNGYAAFFEMVVHSLLIPRQELEDLRKQLQDASRNILVQVTDWRPGVDALIDELQGVHRAFGTITRAPNGDQAIRDERGKLWTKDSLDRAIALTGEIGAQIDPLINQLLADEDVRQRFTRNQDDIPGELKKLLNEMIAKNQEFTWKIRNDAGYAFEKASLSRPDEKNPADVPGLRWKLSGIHARAHEAVGEFFERDRYYAIGLNAALSVIQFERDMMFIAEFGMVAFCAIFCPAIVAIVVQTGWSLYHEAEIREKKRAYGALMNPEDVYSFAEIEAELFANHVGIVLNFIPADRILIKGLGVDKALVKLGATKAGQYVLKRITREMIEELEKVTIVAFVKFYATGEVMGALMQRMLKPFIEEIQRKHMTLAQLEAAAAEVSE